MFTKALTYQFGIFFPEEADVPRSLVSAVPNALQGTADRKYLLRGLKDPTSETSLVATGSGPLIQTQSQVWTAGAGIWRIVAIRNRIDLYFDANTYKEVKDPDGLPPTVEEITSYIAPKIEDLLRSAGLKAIRLALVVGGQTEPDAQTGLSALVLQKRFPSSFGRPLTDGTIRLNVRGDWQVGKNPELVPVSMIETSSANWVLNNKGPETSFGWQADVNMLPSHDITEYSSEKGRISDFFRKAAEWISERKFHTETLYAESANH